jgi:hypothetical protein
MAVALQTVTLTITTGTGSGTVLGTSANGFRKYDYFMLDANLLNSGTSAVDVYIQRAVTTYAPTEATVWRDWVHFPQLTAATGKKHYSLTPQPSGGIVAVGTGSTPALAANVAVGGHPGERLRLVTVQAGTGTYVAQTQTVHVTAWAGRP